MTNILENGSFETTSAEEADGVTDRGTWFTADSIDGWRATQGLIEIQVDPAAQCGVPSDPTGLLTSGAVLELDSHNHGDVDQDGTGAFTGKQADSTVTQNFTLDTASTFELGFSYAARFSAATSDFDVTITDASGTIVFSQEFSRHENNLEVAWQRFAEEIDLEAGDYTLAFSSRSFADRDTVGALIDNVSLIDVVAANTPEAADDMYTLDLGNSQILEVDAVPDTTTQDVTLYEEDFEGERHLDRLDGVADSDLIGKNGSAFSNSHFDGVLAFEPVDVSGVDNGTVSFFIETDGRNRSGFEAADARFGDYVRVEISVDGGAFELLDLFEVREEDLGLRGDLQTFVGSLTGQTFDADGETLSYALPDGAESVEVRFVTEISASDEIIRIDDVVIAGQETVQDGYQTGLLANDSDPTGDALEIVSAEGVDLFTFEEQTVTALEENFDGAPRDLEDLDTVHDSDLIGTSGVARADRRNDGELEFETVSIAGLDNEVFAFSLNADALGRNRFESSGWARDFVKVQVRFDDGHYETIDTFDVVWENGEQVFVGSQSGQEVAVSDGFVDLSYDLAALAGDAETAQVRLIAEVTGKGEIFEVDDVSLIGTQSVRSGPGIATITLASGAIVTIHSDGSFRYDANNQFAFLSEGEMTTDTFSYTVQDSSGLQDTAEVTIKLVGANEGVFIGNAVTTGAVKELADGAANEGTAVLSAAGTIAFTDVDLADSHNVAVTPAAAGYRGNLSALVTDAATGDGSGVVTWTFDVSDGALDDLAEGQQLTQTYTIAITDGQGGLDTETVTITLTGTNDAPRITLTSPDVDEATLTETDAGLNFSSTLTYVDPDLADSVDVQVIGVVTSGTGDSGLTPDDTALLAMLTLAPNPVLSGVETLARRAWTFDSGTEAFDFLAAGQDLILTYTIEATDSQGATDTHEITVTIDGTNDAPQITLTSPDVDEATLTETDAGLNFSSTLTYVDPDLADSVDVQVIGVVTSGTGDSGLTPDDTALLAMLTLAPNPVLSGVE
ncbi:MAG: VCBS domain-containing protein, partial [Pseudomonadota bacterium]